jgi:hypothetical protein
MSGSLTISLSATQLARILRILSDTTPDAISDFQVSAEQEHDNEQEADLPDLLARELGFLLSGRAEQLVRYITANHGEVENDDLARELGFKNPAYTSSLLGKITGKLRRIGVQAEGRDGVNWYSKRRVDGRTLLRVRADVLKILDGAVASIPR